MPAICYRIAVEMHVKDIRGLAKAERRSSLEAKQCTICARWFTVKKGSRTLCFRCEEGQ